MRTYDPADHIRYVHLAQDTSAPVARPRPQDECHPLPAGYANDSLRPRPVGPRAVDARPPLVVLLGGSAGSGAPAPARPELRLAR